MKSKPVTARELITWIESYFDKDYPLHLQADEIILACKAFLEEMENGT